MEEEKMRLQKAMSTKGICSRREAERLIADGKVKVNGNLVTEMGFLVTLKDEIEVIGRPTNTEVNQKIVTFLFNKPIGVVSSAHDDRGRKTVVDFFKNEPYRLYPVGRLDFNTSGAILVSNDGELTNLVTHPSSHLNKTYTVTIKGYVKDEELDHLRKGVMLEDGLTQPAEVELIKRYPESTTLSITIHEGKNRQIRRMIEYFHYEVKMLNRDKIGFLTLNNLSRGEYRLLTEYEINLIKNLTKHNKKFNSYSNIRHK